MALQWFCNFLPCHCANHTAKTSNSEKTPPNSDWAPVFLILSLRRAASPFLPTFPLTPLLSSFLFSPSVQGHFVSLSECVWWHAGVQRSQCWGKEGSRAAGKTWLDGVLRDISALRLFTHSSPRATSCPSWQTMGMWRRQELTLSSWQQMSTHSEASHRTLLWRAGAVFVDDFRSLMGFSLESLEFATSSHVCPMLGMVVKKNVQFPADNSFSESKKHGNNEECPVRRGGEWRILLPGFIISVVLSLGLTLVVYFLLFLLCGCQLYRLNLQIMQKNMTEKSFCWVSSMAFIPFQFFIICWSGTKGVPKDEDWSCE